MKIPSKEKVASFDVDAMKTFTPICPDELPVPEGDKIGAELNKQAEKARIRIGSKDAHSPNAIWVATDENPQFSPIEGKDVDVRWNVHAVPGTMGFELLDELPKPSEYRYFVYKGIEVDQHPYSACYHDFANTQSTGVIEVLQVEGIETVIVGGLALDYCVATTATQLKEAGFDVVINLSGTRGIAAETVDEAIAKMEAIGIRFVENAELLKNHD
ncbi:hypothetical protein VMF7928_02799 [Vibrio marisflavi CECT 7928]|uniref:nicotinamidase n=1 Tax=Vibrio marisflavi CECT 7928 TaxID=634439 RepID=A0ABN8E862_9VIBR|nr:hypothetical protein VMF7928_02799 [Vibrio marisflavi CECT 7928]